MVYIGTPVYIFRGYNVVINCRIIYGTPPITIEWLRNGLPDTTRGNTSSTTITDAKNGDVFTCKADNINYFTTENTTIYVEISKYLCMYIRIMYL